MSKNSHEIKLRKGCVELYKSGKSPTEISEELKRSRPWTYKWIKRYKSGKENWYEDESKAPKSHPTKLTPELESEIVKIRKTLTRRETLATRYAYHGAIAIYQKLDEAGYPYLPHISTINRVLKRNHLIQEKISRKLQKQTKTYYPEIYPKHPGDIYAMDLVTPRYIKGFGRIISVNRVDTYTGFANINQYRTKEADNIINFVAEDWRKHAKPNYLKLDNEACFKGSLNFPRTFGKLTRFCLNFGVQIVFIPFQEPWRNGFIESFNGRFNDMLWSFMDFKNLAHLRNEAKLFIDQHNQYQNYKNNRYNKLFMLNYKTRQFPDTFSFNKSNDLPITKGYIHFIRFVNEKGYVNILNEEFYISKQLSFGYVWLTIDTAQQYLNVYYRSEKRVPRNLIKTFNYQLRETAKNPIPVMEFC